MSSISPPAPTTSRRAVARHNSILSELLIFLERQRRLLRTMVRLLLVLFRGLRSALRSHADLMLENLALRQQLAAGAHSGVRFRSTPPGSLG
jgi:hypothetical protein